MYIVAHPGALCEYRTLNDAIEKTRFYADGVQRSLIVYEIREVSRIAPDPAKAPKSPEPPKPPEPKRLA